MEQNIKKLPESLQPKGTGIPGLIATLVKRTDKVAWYLRNDGYNEIFLIKTGQTFDGKGLMEYYPGTDQFGILAWCSRSAETAARYYAVLCRRSSVNERSDTYPHKDTSSRQQHRIRRPRLQFQHV